MVRCLIACFIAITIPVSATPTTPEGIAIEILAPLLDPVKVATLKGDRPANARLYKVLHWLETARRLGGDVSEVIDTAQKAARYGGSVGAKADKSAIVWSRKNLERWGCFTPEGMEKMRKGGSPLPKSP
jgi:hypothetical protein